jgi:VWFA-related protein
LSENKVLQEIATFEAIDRASLGSESQGPTPPRAFAVVFDDMGMTRRETAQANEAVRSLLDSRWRPGDAVSVWLPGLGKAREFSMPSAIPAAGDFARLARGQKVEDTEPRKRMSAFEAHQIIQGDQRTLDDVARRFLGGGVGALGASAGGDGRGGGDLESVYSEVRAKASEIETEGRSRAWALKDGLEQAFRWIQPRNGAKAVILLSPGFAYGSIDDRYAEIAAASLAAGAALYLVDPEGMRSAAAGIEETPLFNPYQAESASNQAQMTTMAADSLAIESGGATFHNRNDLKEAFALIDSLSQTYYLLGYDPKDPSRDGRYRAIDVKVEGSGLSVRARRGYRAPSDAPAPH